MKISSDYRDLLRGLNAAGVRYLIVGGYAVMIYTEPDYTKDLDIWIDPTLKNAEALFRALAEFGAPLKGIAPRDSTEPEVFYQMGVEPVRVGVLTSIPGVQFPEGWKNKRAVDFDGEPAFVIGREELVRSKDLTARKRDRAHSRRLGKRSEGGRPRMKIGEPMRLPHELSIVAMAAAPCLSATRPLCTYPQTAPWTGKEAAAMRPTWPAKNAVPGKPAPPIIGRTLAAEQPGPRAKHSWRAQQEMRGISQPASIYGKQGIW